MSKPTFEDFIAEVEGEARREGSAAIAELEDYRQHFRLLADIAERRRALGLSQAQLAKRAGLYQGDLSRIESGKANPESRTLMAIAVALDSDVRLVPHKRSTPKAGASGYRHRRAAGARVSTRLARERR